MSVSIITFANLGKKTNLKTGDILPVIDTLVQKNELRQIICQIASDFYFPNTRVAIPTVIRYGMRVLEKYFRIRFSRQMTEDLFDHYAAQKLERADIYVFHGGYFLPKTFQAARNLGGIVIDIAVGAHLKTSMDLEHEEFNRLGIKDFRGTSTGLHERSSHANSFDYIIAASEFSRQSYISAGYSPEKVFVTAFDIDRERFRSKEHPKQDTFTVLYVAYTTPLKGLHYLLEAWHELKLTHAKLLVVGGSADLPLDLKKRYERSVSEDPSIMWLQSTNKPEDLYQKASVFVFPSLTEGFGRVTLEAMACGVPVITTENAQGIVEDGKTGFVVPIRDAAALKEKIDYLYRNPDVTEAMGKNARLAVEEKISFGDEVYRFLQEIQENRTV